MKPDWDKLMNKFKTHATTLVADVDCTADNGKPLCNEHGVKGFPTIKHGDPSALDLYEGGRDFKSLSKFADSIKPSCSPNNIDLCDDEARAKIESIQALSLEEITTQIAEGEAALAEAEATFKAEVAKLQATYEGLQKIKEAAQAAVKAQGLGLLKSVAAAKKKASAHDEL